MKKCLTWHPQNLQQSSPVLLWHHQFLQCGQKSYLHLPSPFPIWPTSHLSEKHLMLFLSKEWPGSSLSFISSASSVSYHCAGNCIHWLGCPELKLMRRRGEGRGWKGSLGLRPQRTLNAKPSCVYIHLWLAGARATGLSSLWVLQFHAGLS